LSECEVHSFIIKLCIEEVSEGAGAADWRGYITHVPSGRRGYLKDLSEITAFITPYLEARGVRVGMWWGIRRWLRRFRG
jgi:hypothetical protein